MGLTRIELAVKVGLGEKSVYRYEQLGVLDSVRLPDGTYDPERAVELLNNRRGNPGKAGRPPKPRVEGAPTLFELQAEHEAVKIHERKIKVRERERRLVDRQSVQRALRERTERLKESWLAWPVQIAPLVVALTGGELRPVLDLIERECRSFLDRMANELSHEVRTDDRGRAA